MKKSYFEINNRIINPIIKNNFTGYLNVDTFHFIFDDEWEDLDKTLVITEGDDVYNVTLLNDEALIPNEAYTGASVISIGVFGTKIINQVPQKILATPPCKIQIQKGVYEEGEEPSNLPTPTQWDLYVAEINRLLNLCNADVTTCQEILEDIEEIEAQIEIYKNAAVSASTSAQSSATSAEASATSASNSATSAATSATEASNSATSASTSATNASTSASNASTSATNAQNSATSAASSASQAEEAEEHIEEIIEEFNPQLENKVDKIPGKGLSTNDYDNIEKQKVADNTNARHTHSNKNILDGIGAQNITNWNNKAEQSDIPDVSNFITRSVNNLLNYYLKSETYTKAEVNTLIGQIQTVRIEVVQTLPTTGQSNVIYFVPKETPQTGDVYEEYIYTNSTWELIGSTQVDLTGYATETWVNQQISNFLTQTEVQTLITTALNNYYTKTESDNRYVSKETGKGLSTNDYDNTEKANVASNTIARHTHSNKAILDATTASFTTEKDATISTLSTEVQNIKSKFNHIYGIRRKKIGNSASAWERTDDSIGLIATATKNGADVQNSFDNLYPWKDIISFNLNLTTHQKVAYYGDPDFKFDGTNGDVYTSIPEFWYKIFERDGYEYVQIANYAATGFTRSSPFDVARYLTGMVDGKLRSYSGIAPAYNKTIVQFRTLANELGNNYCLLDWRYFLLQLLYLVEYADYNSQNTLGNGMSSMRYNASDKALIAENSTNRIVINTAGGNAFLVGQTISIGTGLDNFSVAADRVITAIADYSADGVTGKAITFNGNAVNIVVNNVVWSSGQHSGSCDGLGMKSGCYSNDSKHGVIYRGIENIFGNIFQWVDGINIKDYQAYICYDPTQYVSDKFESPYVALGYIDANTNGNAKTLGFDSNNPLVRLPTEVGGSSSTYMCDYYYQNSGNRVARVGGYLHYGSLAGLWYWDLNHASSSASWNFGARVLKYQ